MELSDKFGLDKLQMQLNIGEDFEILFIIPSKIKEFLTKQLDFKVIGEIIDKNTLEIVLSNGDLENLSTNGYDHFKC